MATVAAISALSLRKVYLVPAGLFFVASTICPRVGAYAFLPILLAAIASVGIVARSPDRLRKPLLSED